MLNARQDRLCRESFAAGENPATYQALTPWDETDMTQWRHVLHYRDLYQQKLAYVREFLSSEGSLAGWEAQEHEFLKATIDGAQASGGSEAMLGDPLRRPPTTGRGATVSHAQCDACVTVRDSLQRPRLTVCSLLFVAVL